MNDNNTTLTELKTLVHEMCVRKGWGNNGVQNPQQVAMAMTVEMSELLEHFQWLNPEDVNALMEGRDPERRAMIAEEFADIMMYGLQLMRTLDIDITGQIIRKIDIVITVRQSPTIPSAELWRDALWKMISYLFWISAARRLLPWPASCAI